MKRKLKVLQALLFCAVSLGIGVLVSPAATHYVDQNGTNATPPYTTWSTAATNIPDAVGAAVAGDEIVVTNGVYGPVAVDKLLTLRSINGPDVTTIDGGGSARCVYLTNNASLSGFTLTNGSLLSGGGAYGGTLTNCTLSGNLHSGAWYSTLNNCAVTSNFGGGAWYSTLNNCTLVGNSGGGAWYGTLNNCVVSFNGGQNYDSSSTLNYCCTTPLPAAGLGNIANDPLFVDQSGGNVRLQPSSPCINAGNNAYVVGTTDLDGNPRIAGGAVDIGAYEFQTTASRISYVFTHLAGSLAGPGYSDGAGSAARFSFPYSVAVDSAGNIYVADTGNSTIRKTTPGGVVTTLAGLAGNVGSDDGTGSAARFQEPSGVAVDSAGNVYVADTGNFTIRKITPGGVVTTLAGLAGNVGSDDGTGSAARFQEPYGLAVDSAGNVYVADSYNSTIRKITPGGDVTTLAGLAGSYGSADGTGSAARFYVPFGVAVDPVGNVYVADTYNYTIRKITAGGVVTTLAGLAGTPGSADGTGSAGRFHLPDGVVVDSAGNVYVADTFNHTIRKIAPGGVVTTLAGLAGNVGSGDGTGSAARFNYPQGVALDSSRNVYVADTFNHTIRKITPGGVVTTLSGLAAISGTDDGAGSAARFTRPFGVAVDSSGNVYVADSDNHTIRKITPGGVVATLAGLAGASGTNDGTGSAARFYNPHGVAVDSSGNVYVADAYNHTIRHITPGGVVTTVAGLAGTTGSADGTGSAARFYYPHGVAVDSSGNVYVADSDNNTIRKITPGGVVTTLAGLAGTSGSADGTGSAALFFLPYAVAVDSAGNVYVVDSENDTIRKITPGGVVTTLAGLAGSIGSADGTGSAARFYFPLGVAVDSAGNVYVADYYNYAIRKITPGGVVTTPAGLARAAGSEDGTGSAARFYYPHGVAVDSAGNVYVADSGNNAIRKGWLAVALAISLAGDSVTLSWPTNAVGFSLEQSLALGTTNWSSVTNMPTVTGTDNQVMLPATGAAFFRLKK